MQTIKTNGNAGNFDVAELEQWLLMVQTEIEAAQDVAAETIRDLDDARDDENIWIRNRVVIVNNKLYDVLRLIEEERPEGV